MKRDREITEETETEPERERQQHAITNKIRFGEPYENTRKHSKHDVGQDLVVVPVEIEIVYII
jgi:hypothetical protein